MKRKLSEEKHVALQQIAKLEEELRELQDKIRRIDEQQPVLSTRPAEHLVVNGVAVEVYTKALTYFLQTDPTPAFLPHHALIQGTGTLDDVPDHCTGIPAGPTFVVTTPDGTEAYTFLEGDCLSAAGEELAGFECYQHGERTVEILFTYPQASRRALVTKMFFSSY